MGFLDAGTTLATVESAKSLKAVEGMVPQLAEGLRIMHEEQMAEARKQTALLEQIASRP